MKLYLLINQETQGPLSLGEVRARLRAGTIPPQAKWSTDQQNWVPLEDLPRSPWLAVACVAVGLLVGLGIVGGMYFHKHFRTPASTEPPPPNVSFKKWEKTSTLQVKIEPTQWEQRLGRNLHRAAYQAATNLVSQTLAKPETAQFKPFHKAKITGIDTRFLVKGHYEAVNKSGETHQYGYHIYLKRETNEVWTVEYLDKDKDDPGAKSGKKAGEKAAKAAE